jgi:MFS family permease
VSRARTLVPLASLAVAFAAADTYVVVLALPDMMAGIGMPIDALQRATPIISGFLLGYVAVLPLIGRIADLRGRVPVLIGSLAVFALGSLLTAASHDLTAMVVGRLVQGVGAGGLVPATLALVADLYPEDRRAVPLGVVGAVQEIGSVVGPLWGAVVIALWSWRGIFWLNVVVAVLIGVALTRYRATRRATRPSWTGVVLGVVAAAVSVVLLFPPQALRDDLTWGLLYAPLVGSSGWTTPLSGVLALTVLALLAQGLLSGRPLVPVRSWTATAAAADPAGSVLLAGALAGVIVTFASADPQIQVIAPHGGWYLVASGLLLAAFIGYVSRARRPLVPRGLLRPAPAWGAVLVSFLIGSALIAALVDIPVFARVTIYPDSQLQAALVLVRFLVAVPVGAVLGGQLTHRWSAGPVTFVGAALAVLSFWLMSRWGLESLSHWSATIPLVVGGLGFGLVLAPVNAALLAATDPAEHGVASALVVVARMVGMLVGISVLTTIALHRYYGVLDGLPSIDSVCDGPTTCTAYTTLLRESGLIQLETVFRGAALSSAAAGVIALVVFRRRSGRPLG